jgi:hypothetical protein
VNDCYGEDAIGGGRSGVELGEERFCALVGCEEGSCCGTDLYQSTILFSVAGGYQSK